MAENNKKVGLIPVMLMVAGNIMGSGVFLLPANLASTGGIAIYGWLITIVGAIALSIVYAKISSIDRSPGGSYAYARRAFGPFLGYQTNMLYWVAAWVGNIAIVVVGVGYLSYFFPFLKEPIPAAICSIGILWGFVLINISGPRLMTKVQAVTTVLALIPIIGVAVFGWFWFKSSTYMEAWNVSGKSSLSAVQSVLNITLWAFIGVETASVVAGVVENPKKNVPIATVGGVLIAAVSYILSSTAIMGMIPNAELQVSSSPFGDAVAMALGKTAGAVVAFCAMLGCLGSVGGWTLVAGQTAKAAADDGLFPKIFGKVNKDGIPVTGLIIVGILMTILQLTTISPNAAKQFGVVSSITVIFTVIPYIYTCAALMLIGHGNLGEKRNAYIGIIGVAFIYCIWSVISSDSTTVLGAFVSVLITTALYAFNYNRTHKGAYPLDSN
ncbi:arginine/agmatine antiporter [Pedobacter sp. PLR]|uniref:arginine/agmatine antiporter n=1 Tax=Pedobacter sp. PLR TaxID=2994465 RepID=UPI0022450A67|nr:arginine/agmatine antiporter [Pedobacter sp. PLR]MCX2451318.1 arginine/agmatine antiporter [Pedobacter sp. PLR]